MIGSASAPPALSSVPSRSPIPLCVLVLFALSVLGCYVEEPPAPAATLHLLMELLNDQDPLMRRTAAEALGKIGDGSAEPLLQRALQDVEPKVREAAVLALARLPVLGEASARGIASLLGDEDLAVRRAAAHALGQADDAPASIVPPVAGLLRDPDPAVRRAAAHALSGIGANRPEAAEVLIERSGDPDASVRRWVIAALAESGDPRAVRAVADRLLYDHDDGVRIEAAYRLRFLSEPTALDGWSRAPVEANPAVQRWVEASRRSFTKASGSD